MWSSFVETRITNQISRDLLSSNLAREAVWSWELKKVENQESLLHLLMPSLPPDPGLKDVGASTIDVVISDAPSPEDHSQDLIFEIFRVLRPGGKLACYEPMDGRTFEESEVSRLNYIEILLIPQKLKVNLTISGFTDTRITAEGQCVKVSSVVLLLFSQT